jgi:hypothetical protein
LHFICEFKSCRHNPNLHAVLVTIWLLLDSSPAGVGGDKEKLFLEYIILGIAKNDIKL